jgi:hypothetical protein
LAIDLGGVTHFANITPRVANLLAAVLGVKTA